ncbi:MAG: LysR family transcriptional regulator [Gammaproteobacteria bacterium]|nr:LysR family transcriptional regulator [Gammaproteobacteria bacterium]
MDITFIRTYLELCRSRHFGKTAQSLFITQSAVSARIRHLEEQLGVKLLTRDRNNIQLTPAGVRFQRHAEGIVSLWNIARQETALEDESKTLMSIGGVYSLWDTVLISWLGKLRESRPDLAVRAEALDSNSIITRIREGSVDMGFFFDAPRVNQIKLFECGKVEFVMVATEANLTAKQAVEKDNYILVDWGTEFTTSHANLFPNMATVSLRVNLGRLALDQIVRYGGSAYLAREMIQPYIDTKEIFPVLDAPTIERKFYIGFSINNPRQDMIEDILNTSFASCSVV